MHKQIEKNIGQMFILGFHGPDLSKESAITRDIREKNLGGVILFDRHLASKSSKNNIISATQLKSLTSSLQQQAAIPLLIAVDQEGGKICRLKPENSFPATATAAKLGLQNDLLQTTIHSLAVADMLQTTGINFNLAPVVDLNTYKDNPIIGRLDRSFSDQPAQVTAHAAAWIKAHRTRDILCCLKHFPGHGSSQNDSHLGFVDISDTWVTEEMLPFAELIQTDLADAIMPGHLFHSAMDPALPASMSPEIINGILRKKMGFDNVVITDDLQMKAITDHYGLEKAVCMAVSAGVDIMIIGNNLSYDPSILDRMIQAIVNDLDRGSLQESQIWEAISRIKKLKEKGHLI